MQYNSEANNQDCISEISALCGGLVIDADVLDNITRRFNFSLDDYFSLAFRYGRRTDFDDINESSPPIDTQNLVNTTNRYKLSAFSEIILELFRLELLDESGNGYSITKEYFKDLDDVSFQERYVNAILGKPTRYMIYGGFIYLDRIPENNITDGLMAYFNRPAVYMDVAATTAVPGIPTIHIPYLCKKTAHAWLMDNNVKRANTLKNEIMEDRESIKKYFGKLNNDQKDNITTKYITFR